MHVVSEQRAPPFYHNAAAPPSRTTVPPTHFHPHWMAEQKLDSLREGGPPNEQVTHGTGTTGGHISRETATKRSMEQILATPEGERRKIE